MNPNIYLSYTALRKIVGIVVEGDAEDVRGMYCPTHHLITSDMNPLHSEAV